MEGMPNDDSHNPEAIAQLTLEQIMELCPFMGSLTLEQAMRVQGHQERGMELMEAEEAVEEPIEVLTKAEVLPSQVELPERRSAHDYSNRAPAAIENTVIKSAASTASKAEDYVVTRDLRTVFELQQPTATSQVEVEVKLAEAVEKPQIAEAKQQPSPSKLPNATLQIVKPVTPRAPEVSNHVEKPQYTKPAVVLRVSQKIEVPKVVKAKQSLSEHQTDTSASLPSLSPEQSLVTFVTQELEATNIASVEEESPAVLLRPVEYKDESMPYKSELPKHAQVAKQVIEEARTLEPELAQEVTAITQVAIALVEKLAIDSELQPEKSNKATVLELEQVCKRLLVCVEGSQLASDRAIELIRQFSDYIEELEVAADDSLLDDGMKERKPRYSVNGVLQDISDSLHPVLRGLAKTALLHLERMAA